MDKIEDEKIVSDETPIDAVNYILGQSIQSRASDVHLDPERDSLKVRFRVDGILYLFKQFDKYQQEKILSRIKVLSRLDISDHQLPKDGHLEFNYENKNYNIRVTTVATTYGESMSLRILDRDDIIVKIEGLGMDKEQLEIVSKLISNPYGLVVITGPTSSGKTTLLYSIINVLNNSERSIITVEDPIEYNMVGIRQIQIRENLGIDFAKAMRSIARQDPNIIMLGEIRDPDTAQMVFQASLSGALVLSTFHTFDVPGMIIRLLEMGMPRSVIAHAIKGVISARLIRKICPDCKSNYEPGDFEKKILNIDGGTNTFYKGIGCNRCHNTGYLGRIGLFNITPFDDDIRFSIVESATVSSMKDLLKSKKIKDLWSSAMEKILDGTTTVEEAIRVLGYPTR